jgi:two-component system, chemotaxis family, sensor kinase Cph1
VRMDGLLDSLLHFSRVGRTALQLEAVDLNEIVAEALELVEARRSEVATDVVLPRPLPSHFPCDRVRVREIFVNLMSNALKFSDKPRRRVEVGYVAPGEDGERGDVPAEAGARHVFYVRDDGIGIAPRHHEQIFKMFRQLHGREAYGGGSGAGLTIVKKLVERHRGNIWLASAPGAGTTFYFTLEGDAA